MLLHLENLVAGFYESWKEKIAPTHSMESNFPVKKSPLESAIAIEG
jgi:hypothetical protein